MLPATLAFDGDRFAGCTIKSLSVPVVESNLLGNPRVWLSSELKLSGSANDPDIFSADAEVADGMISFTFGQPVTIPQEGLYAGYSFKIEKVTDDNLADPVLTRPTGREGGTVYPRDLDFQEMERRF